MSVKVHESQVTIVNRAARQSFGLARKDCQEFTANIDAMDAPSSSLQSTSERVINLLNDASLVQSANEKVRNLLKVQELVVNKDQALLDNFTDEVLIFQGDRSPDVRKFVIGFMEEASKKDNELLTKVIANLNLLLSDDNANVIKKLIQSMTQLFGIVLNWLRTTTIITDSHKACWKVALDIKERILELLDSSNDGIRTQCIKFAEKVVLLLSEPRAAGDATTKPTIGFALNELPFQHKLLKYDELKEDGEKALNVLLAFVSNPAISSVNLMAAMGSLTGIARLRPQFMGTVVQAFENLHANLPPTLAKTQVTSVRKHLKMQMINMLRLASSLHYHPQITNLLYDLGTTSSEIAKNMPRIGQHQAQAASKKTANVTKVETSSSVKIKKEAEDSDDDDNVDASSSSVNAADVTQPLISQQSIAIDVTAKELLPLLSPENVANLVLLSMVMLPDKMPDAFQASYTPIESAGTEEQIGHLARLLSIQMTAMKIGSGIKKASEIAAQEKEIKKKSEGNERPAKDRKLKIQTVIGGTTKPLINEDAVKDKKAKENIEAMISSQTVVPRHGIHRRIQGFKLETITTPLSLEVKDKIVKLAVERVIKSERTLSCSLIHRQWQKILPSLVAQFGGDLHRTLAEFILQDVRNRSCLAFSWLYEEFNIYLENSRGSSDSSALENYDACLTGLLQGFRDNPEVKDNLFGRLVIQAPLLTDGSIRQVTLYCDNEKRASHGIELVSRLVLLRPIRRMQFLRILLVLCTSGKEPVQLKAIENVQMFYQQSELQGFIQTYAVTHLNYLTMPSPPKSILHQATPTGTTEKSSQWTETTIKLCLALFLSLLPLDHGLIMDLADVYVQANGDIKRVVLRVLDVPVTKMGMNSPDLLHLVEGCPKGAETLVTRMLHILTDGTQPSIELVKRVRDLYIKRVPDVRFLIPVLNGLEKHEVLKALPKLVQLSPTVVKGVFNRLLGVNRSHDSESFSSALTPVELLVALHNIDSSVVDVKNIIKATSFCFAQKAVYTSEALVTVINQLVDKVPLPTLLMRTVIQSVITYPRLSGFVMNVLQRLIMKKVWEQRKVWEGFVKCCQRLKPQSFQVLLQLPSAQLLSVFECSPDLRGAMKQYVDRFTKQQKLHVNQDIVVLLDGDPTLKELEKTRSFSLGSSISDFPAEIISHHMLNIKREVSLNNEEIVRSAPKVDGSVLERVNSAAESPRDTLDGVSAVVSDDLVDPSDASSNAANDSAMSQSSQVKLVMSSVGTQGQKRRSPTPTLDETPESKVPRVEDDY